MTRLFTGSEHQEIAVITDTFRSSGEPSEFLPAENKILEVTLAVSYYFRTNNISAAEYHLREKLVRLSVQTNGLFDEFYEAVSDISFSSRNTHKLLYSSVLGRRDIPGSSMVFLVLSSWDSYTDALLKELERYRLRIVVCYISDNEEKRLDLSGHKNCGLIQFSPYRDITKGLREWGR